MNISLELYKTFYYVAKNESITKASNELMISQPAISKSIKTLENQLNINLFIRKREGVFLTKEGEILYKKIKNAIELINSAENDLKTLTNMEIGTLNIGASKTIIHEFLMPYIKLFHEKYPKISIKIYTDQAKELIKKQELGLIDVLFINMPYSLPKELTIHKLITLHDCFVANSEKFNYLKNKKISKEELANLPLLLLNKSTITRSLFEKYCYQNNIKITPEMEFSSNSLIKDFTIAGFGIGMLTKENIDEEIKNNKLFKLNFDLTLEEKYLAMIHNTENHNFTLKKFIEFIKNSK